jgi:hypothetical protein
LLVILQKKKAPKMYDTQSISEISTAEFITTIHQRFEQ